MNKIILLLTLTISIYGNSQIKKIEVQKPVLIGKVVKAFVKMAELSYTITESKDTLYDLYYSDYKFKSVDVWKHCYFKGGSATLNEFYTMCKQLIDSPKGKQIEFTLGDYIVIMSADRLAWEKSLYIGFTDKAGIMGIFMLDKRKIDDLFGKKEEEKEEETES